MMGGLMDKLLDPDPLSQCVEGWGKNVTPQNKPLYGNNYLNLKCNHP